MTIKITNIFDTITDSNIQANELQTRADLMIVLTTIIEEKEWKQKDIAKALGLSQPRVSNLMNGHIESFSIDMLMACLYRFGYRFKPEYKKSKLKMMVEIVD